MPAHKLHYRKEFQGLPISVENRKGSKRHWYDVKEQKEGVTVMKNPYGYIRGTLGMDGDEVDVYIGKDEGSTRVFIITQNKAPEFKQIDEQKVMLGFSSAAKAKLAYLAHLNKPGFFRGIKEMSLEQFKAKLASQKGKLIKGGLIAGDDSARIDDTVVAKSKKTPKGKILPERVKKEKSMTTASADLNEITKALTAAFANGIASRARMTARMEAYDAAMRAFGAVPVDDVPVNVGIAEEQPVIGTSRERDLAEPPVVPVRAIHNEVLPTSQEPSVYKACGGCGRMSKSLTCVPCDERVDPEATPIWRR